MASHNIVYFTGYPSWNGYPANWQTLVCQIPSQQQQFTYRKSSTHEGTVF